MRSRVSKVDTGVSVCFIASAVIHLTVFLLLAWWQRLSPPPVALQETYYVDVVSMPTADPQPAAAAVTSAAPLSAPPPVPQMSTAKPAAKVVTKAVKPQPWQDSAATESAFAERMAALERNTETRREEAVLDKLRSKVKSGGTAKAGASGTGGAEAGSRYADYIKSRLEDALKVTSSFTTKKPEVAVRLTIAADGTLARIKIERSSGDATFELAVRRAIDLASEKFTAPPNRTVFENGFIFKPQGISSGALR
jgi:colicin import membrane protein